ncbi:DUF6449 domain-containing protein [Bacillus sp. S/N-304-OC-R1]|uniref:DUF6449 domain-containing protein n=1 Tax=Bacillus sp. S/N-304-OC-R1 TaxID=2758034 RepID=UPI0021AE463C|nr:DUF6449 domain-containing protein [Bacillus sp. S/N-304-OC-R1]
MQSKISLVNKEIVKTIFRSVGWVSILYFLGLFIFVPLEIIMSESLRENNLYFVSARNLFQYNAEIQNIFSIALPVLLAIFLFRFLHVKSYSDFIHSMPIKRERIYHIYTLLGAAILITPVILNALIIFIIYGPLHLDEFLKINDVFYWLGMTVMFNLVVYMAAVFVAMITGLSVVQGGLTYIFLLLPIGLIVLLGYNLPFYLYGFPEQYFMQNNIESFSPLVAFSQLSGKNVGFGEILIYILLIIILYAVSLWVYKHRKLEAVSQALIFPFMKPIFKYGSTFCAMLLGGTYFGRTESGTFWLIAGYLFGAIVGYFIAEMVLQKSWRIVIHIRGLLIYACAMAFLVILFQFDFTHYEKNIPYTNEVEKVHFGNSFYRYTDAENKYFLKDKENIELIRRFHKEIVANKGERNRKGESAFFVYELKNGKKIVRNYEIDKNKFAQFYKLIYETPEYKRVTNPIFQVKENEIEKITIQPYGPVDKHATIVDPSDIKAAISILKDEINKATYEEMEDDRDSYSAIRFMLQNNDEPVSMEWRASYKEFEKWLDEKGLLENSRLTASDIDFAYIAPKDQLHIDFSGYSHEEVLKQMEELGNALKVTDPDKLEMTLENSHSYINGQYIIALRYKNDRYTDVRTFSASRIPEFVKQFFE